MNGRWCGSDECELLLCWSSWSGSGWRRVEVGASAVVVVTRMTRCCLNVDIVLWAMECQDMMLKFEVG